MSEWLLIVVLISSQPSISTTVVKDEASCDAAMVTLDGALKMMKLRAVVMCGEIKKGTSLPPEEEEKPKERGSRS